jgi:hypothetical protein
MYPDRIRLIGCAIAAIVALVSFALAWWFRKKGDGD